MIKKHFEIPTKSPWFRYFQDHFSSIRLRLRFRWTVCGGLELFPLNTLAGGLRGHLCGGRRQRSPARRKGSCPLTGPGGRPPWLRTSSPGFCHQAGRLPLGRPATRNGFGGTFRDKGPHGPSASSPEPVRESSPGCRRCCFGGLGVSVLLVAGAAGLTDGSRRAEACPRASFGGC